MVMRIWPGFWLTRIRATPVFSVISSRAFSPSLPKVPNLSLTQLPHPHTIHSASYLNPVFYVNYRGFQIHNLCISRTPWGGSGGSFARR